MVNCSRCVASPVLVWRKDLPPEHKECPECKELFRIHRCAKCGKEIQPDDPYGVIKYLEGNRYHKECRTKLLRTGDFDVTHIATKRQELGGSDSPKARDIYDYKVLIKVSRKDTKELIYRQVIG